MKLVYISGTDKSMAWIRENTTNIGLCGTVATLIEYDFIVGASWNKVSQDKWVCLDTRGNVLRVMSTADECLHFFQNKLIWR